MQPAFVAKGGRCLVHHGQRLQDGRRGNGTRAPGSNSGMYHGTEASCPVRHPSSFVALVLFAGKTKPVSDQEGGFTGRSSQVKSAMSACIALRTTCTALLADKGSGHDSAASAIQGTRTTPARHPMTPNEQTSRA